MLPMIYFAAGLQAAAVGYKNNYMFYQNNSLLPLKALHTKLAPLNIMAGGCITVMYTCIGGLQVMEQD